MEANELDKLIRLIRDGDSDAGNRLFIHCLGKLKPSRFTRNRHNADDLVQTVLRTFYRRLVDGQYELADENELFGLLNSIMHNRFIDRVRRQKAQKRGGSVNVDPISESFSDLGSSSPLVELILQEEVEELERRMDSINPDLRDIVKLRLEGYSDAQIAERTELSVRTIYRRLKLFREKLQRDFE